MTLIEIATLFGQGTSRSPGSASDLLQDLESSPALQVIPLTVEVAREVASFRQHLSDPADRVIVCTARVHNLQLVTSDERIIDSRLVPVVE